MATESPNSQNSVVERDATRTEVAKIKATNDAAEIPFPPRSESVREEQVQNAVKFLSHPEVRGSPKIYRRSFLEKKGLTKEEIAEAFCLVSDPSPSNAPSVVPTTNQGSNIIPLNNYQQSQINGKSNPDHTAVRPSSSPAAMETTTAPHPKSYMEIIAMIQRGERPSNIREINDMPPNPNQQPSKPALAPRPKPWELSQSNTVEGNSEDQSEPWWKKKTVSTQEIVSDSNNISGLPPPSQRVWLPPHPPTVAIPEAAAAIRHPKKYPSADTADSSNEDGIDSETNIESNGNKLEGSEISVEPMIEDKSEKVEQVDVELHENGDEVEQVKDGVQIS